MARGGEFARLSPSRPDQSRHPKTSYVNGWFSYQALLSRLLHKYASCLALAPTDRHKDLSAWIVGLRQTYSRRHAFKEELMRAMESVGASVSD